MTQTNSVGQGGIPTTKLTTSSKSPTEKKLEKTKEPKIDSFGGITKNDDSIHIEITPPVVNIAGEKRTPPPVVGKDGSASSTSGA